MRQTLDQAIGAAPVSTIDVNDVVAKARRHSRWRRLAVVGAAGGTSIVVVAAGIVVTMVLATSPRTTSELRVPGLLPSSPQSTAEVPAATAPVHAGETREQTGQRIAAALTAGLTAAVPGVRLSNGPTGAPGTVAFFAPNAADQNVGQYSTDTVLTTPTVEQEVFLGSWVGGRLPTDGPTDERQRLTVMWFESCSALPEAVATMPDGSKSVRECEESVGPGGQTIVAYSEVCVDCPGRPAYRHEVFVTWTNARVGLSIAQDTKRGDSSKPLAAPLLSRGQLVAIGVNPDLTAAA